MFQLPCKQDVFLNKKKSLFSLPYSVKISVTEMHHKADARTIIECDFWSLKVGGNTILNRNATTGWAI